MGLGSPVAAAGSTWLCDQGELSELSFGQLAVLPLHPGHSASSSRRSSPCSLSRLLPPSGGAGSRFEQRLGELRQTLDVSGFVSHLDRDGTAAGGLTQLGSLGCFSPRARRSRRSPSVTMRIPSPTLLRGRSTKKLDPLVLRGLPVPNWRRSISSIAAAAAPPCARCLRDGQRRLSTHRSG